MSLVTLAFFPHNESHANFFHSVGIDLENRLEASVIFVRELGGVHDRKVFQFEAEILKKWDRLDISFGNLSRLAERYGNSSIMRAIFSERRSVFYPQYFSRNPVSYEYQMKYLVGCFTVFEDWLSTNRIDYIVSELLIGLADCVLYEVGKKHGVQFIPIRQSKMTPGVIRSIPDVDAPCNLEELYQEFKVTGVPDQWVDIASGHIEAVKAKIFAPSYMESSKKDFRLMDSRRVRFLLAKFGRSKISTNAISLRKHPILDSMLWHWHRFINVFEVDWFRRRLFVASIPDNEMYFLYPLQYEPESSVMVRGFPFTDQIALIHQITRLLPVGVKLVIKEHKGNHGYRKYGDYRKLSYLPNVLLVSRNHDVTGLIKNCLGVISLTSRMGWEALVLGKPAITLGNPFWMYFDGVIKPKSWQELEILLGAIVKGEVETLEEGEYERNLLAFAAAYIAQIYDANFVTGSEKFFRRENISRISEFIVREIQQVKTVVES